MKKIVVLLLTCLLTMGYMQAQTKSIPVEPMVRDYMPAEKLEVYIAERPAKLLGLNYMAIGYCYVTDKIPENSQNMGTLESYTNRPYDAAKILAEKRINPFNFSLQQDAEKYNVYTISNSKFVVVVYPLSEYEKGKAAYLQKYGY